MKKWITLTTWLVCATIVSAQQAQFSYFKYEGKDAQFEQAIDRNTQYMNPILAGFYPDPSVCRVGDSYYLVNSTFGYFPGVPIFKSDDLVNWQQIGHVLDRPSQLPLQGADISRGGIYAPHISYNPWNETYYMTTMNMTTYEVFYVKSKNPEAGWSEPIQMKRGGMDTSFFFDTDGKAYVVYNYNPREKALYEGQTTILLNEFDWKADSVKWETHVLTTGSHCIAQPTSIEGPHLYKVGAYYYLMCAEHGTGFTHSEVIFRSKKLFGQWEECPYNPILTQRDLTDDDRPYPVTCAGHADLVQTPEGDWWAVFLGCRPYKIDRNVWEPDYYNTGRETFLLPVTWKEGWPIILDHGKAVPTVVHVKPKGKLGSADEKKLLALCSTGNGSFTDRFDTQQLDHRWMFLRNPQMACYAWNDQGITLSAQPINLQDNSSSPTAILCRQKHLVCCAETEVSFQPQCAQEISGLVLFQNEHNHFLFGKTILDGKSAIILTRVAQGESTLIGSVLLADEETDQPIRLKVEANGQYYSFSCAVGAGAWRLLVERTDGQFLSTHVAGGFVGTTIGLFAIGKAIPTPDGLAGLEVIPTLDTP